METILNYIENLFLSYPNTPNVRKAKEELLALMEDKYHELKSEGKSENEAIGIVISEFGSMDEIAFALNSDKSLHAEPPLSGHSKETMRLNLKQAQEYLDTHISFGIKIAIGVALCVLSPTPAILTESLYDGGFLTDALSELLGAVPLFLMVALAVGIFITNGIAMGKYEDYEKKQILLDAAAQKKLTGEYESWQTAYGRRIAAGVILCIVSLIPTLFTDWLLKGTSYAWLEDTTALFLFLCVAIAVFLFITSGMRQSAYETLLGKGKAAHKPFDSKKDRRISLVASIYWPIITALYLGWSFFSMNWGMTWVVWPIAGILFGGICSAISIVSSEKAL